MRCDSPTSAAPSLLTGFNPRTYMRCDAAKVFLFMFVCCFNPRTYMRCDAEWRDANLGKEVSIHAPT